MIAEDPKSNEIIKPVLCGRDIKRYQTNWAKLWLITTLPSLHLNIDNYPAIKRHLLSYGREKLEQAGKRLPDGSKSRKKTPHAWFELQDTCAYHAEFSKEKVVYPETMRRSKNSNNSFPRFSLDLCGEFIPDKTTFILIAENIHYLVAILNSQLAKLLLPLYVNSWDNNGFLMQKIYIEKFPVPLISPENRATAEKIVGLAKQIISAKRDTQSVDTALLEEQVDQFIYKLYGLTKEEIRIVEVAK